MILSAHGLSWSVAGRMIVQGVDLVARPGQVLGLMGPNGSGKSTVMRFLAGTARADRGTVCLDGRDLSRMNRREVARLLALVEQQADTDLDLTVDQVIDLGRIPHRGRWVGRRNDDLTVIESAAARTGIAHLLDRRWSTLSGGERQRVHLARALAQQPQVLLLDEPTNHLDISHQLDILSGLHDLGISVVVALHDLNLALTYCDAVVLMRQGRVRASGPTRDVLSADIIREVYDVDCIVRDHGSSAPAYVQFLPR
ncbi:ABC transporter ATP-binding protein [Cutibacterium sp. V970]|uniref:ABC transporter ATP-binding protein n=1 Tax=Cutibacterium sp. V970 TaxID=3446481 RepID=UPI003EE0E446